jgi:hypothetical protein
LLAHPRTVYLREADLLPHLNRWRTGLFDSPPSMPPSTRSSPPARTPAARTAEACARSSGRWPKVSASSPSTERRWTPEQFNFLEVWTSRSSPCRRSFERYPRAGNRSERTITTYLIGLRRADVSQVPPERAR